MGAEVIILANPYTYSFLKGLTHSALGQVHLHLVKKRWLTHSLWESLQNETDALLNYLKTLEPQLHHRRQYVLCEAQTEQVLRHCKREEIKVKRLLKFIAALSGSQTPILSFILLSL